MAPEVVPEIVSEILQFIRSNNDAAVMAALEFMDLNEIHDVYDALAPEDLSSPVALAMHLRLGATPPRPHMCDVCRDRCEARREAITGKHRIHRYPEGEPCLPTCEASPVICQAERVEILAERHEANQHLWCPGDRIHEQIESRVNSQTERPAWTLAGWKAAGGPTDEAPPENGHVVIGEGKLHTSAGPTAACRYCGCESYDEICETCEVAKAYADSRA